VRSTLLDSGALVALFDPSGEEHAHYRAELPEAGVLLTTWPCVTEALHILPRLVMKVALLRWISAAGVSVHTFQAQDVPAMIEWIERYSERREMDFADASLVWLAQTTGCRRIMTTDIRNFTRYRLAGGRGSRSCSLQSVHLRQRLILVVFAHGFQILLVHLAVRLV
jgi:uncharacterized protein